MTDKKELNNQLEAIGWGLFLIMLGGLWLVPSSMVPDGTWLIGVGLIMLGLNVARYFLGIPLSKFTIFLGIVALVVGASDFVGLDLPIFPIILILIGCSIIFNLIFERKSS